jgi:hypothetical protein
MNRLYRERLFTKLTLVARHKYHYKLWNLRRGEEMRERTLSGQSMRKYTRALLTIVVHHSVTIDVRLLNHVLDLFLGQLLTQVGHHATQLGRRDYAVVVLVEHPVDEEREIRFEKPAQAGKQPNRKAQRLS